MLTQTPHSRSRWLVILALGASLALSILTGAPSHLAGSPPHGGSPVVTSQPARPLLAGIQIHGSQTL